MIKISNREARQYVTDKLEFKASNTYGQWESDNIYCVYSFGSHWIMYMYIKHLDRWVGCEEKRSITTSKQTTQLHPNAEIYEWFLQKDIKELKYKLE
jgi:hypothetical protein